MKKEKEQVEVQEQEGQTATVPLETLNLVLQALSQRPYIEVSGIIQKLQSEAIVNQ